VQYQLAQDQLPAVSIYGHFTGCRFENVKDLPKVFQGTIGKIEFDLGPAKLSAEDLETDYLERFASAVRN